MVALVFLGLLARITEMAVLVRWAAAHWDELQEPLGFTRKQPPCDTTISRSLARLSLAEFRQAFSCWLKSALEDRHTRWVAAIDGKTCRQGLAADGSPVHMLNVFLQQAKLTLDEWSVNGDKTNEPGSVQRHLAELLAAYPALELLTGDAIFTQRPLLELLKANGCNYLFQVKANQPDMLGGLQSRGLSLVTTLCVVTQGRTLRVHWRRNLLQQSQFHPKGRGASNVVRSHAEHGNEDFAVLLTRPQGNRAIGDRSRLLQNHFPIRRRKLCAASTMLRSDA